MEQEANIAQEQETTQAEPLSLDEQMDQVLDGVETPAETSSVKSQEGEEVKTDETAGAEPDKTEQVKSVEEDSSLSVEDKIAKVKEILGDDEGALDAYIKEKGYHNDPAWQKQRDIINRLKEQVESSGISEEDKEAIQKAKEVTSSRTYIQASMKEQGYTQDAIDKALKEKGFDVETKPNDDFDLVTSKLNIDPSTISENTKATIADVAKIADVIFQDRLNKVLPEQLKPLQETHDQLTQTQNASKLTSQMRELTGQEKQADAGIRRKRAEG